MFQLQPAIQDYQDKNYKLLKDSEDNHYLADRIHNMGILNFGAVLANQTKSMDLAAKGVLSPIIVRSVYAFSGSTTNDEITFNIYRKNDTGSLTKVAQQRYDNNRMPYSFPFGAVLTPDMVIEVKPRYNVDTMFVYVQPANIVFSISA